MKCGSSELRYVICIKYIPGDLLKNIYTHTYQHIRTYTNIYASYPNNNFILISCGNNIWTYWVKENILLKLIYLLLFTFLMWLVENFILGMWLSFLVHTIYLLHVIDQ